MKILMCNSFYYIRGGAERCFFDLSELLRAHGHEVIPFSMRHERNFPSPYQDYFLSHVDFPQLLGKESSLVDKLKVAERVIYSREARDRIRALIEDTRPDIAHVHGIAAETSPSILPAIKRAGIPIVQTLHDYRLICPNTNFVSQGKICERCKGHRYYNVVLRRCKRDSLGASFLAGLETSVHKVLQIYERHVDIFITPSQFLKDKLVEHGVKSTIVHLPNFVYTDRFTPEFEPQNYFVYYGRLVAVKGVLTLLKAMRRIKDSHLYIAGSGEAEDEMKTFISEHNLTNVTMLGHLDSERLFPLIRGAAFTVVPSEWYENYSMTVIESLALGTPVIGARIGGVPEQVWDGQNGLLFESGDDEMLAAKIRYLLDHRETSIEMGRAGRRSVETNNNPQRHYGDTLALYKNLLTTGTNNLAAAQG